MSCFDLFTRWLEKLPAFSGAQSKGGLCTSQPARHVLTGSMKQQVQWDTSLWQSGCYMVHGKPCKRISVPFGSQQSQPLDGKVLHLWGVSGLLLGSGVNWMSELRECRAQTDHHELDPSRSCIYLGTHSDVLHAIWSFGRVFFKLFWLRSTVRNIVIMYIHTRIFEKNVLQY